VPLLLAVRACAQGSDLGGAWQTAAGRAATDLEGDPAGVGKGAMAERFDRLKSEYQMIFARLKRHSPA
jgi:hypothetical protein